MLLENEMARLPFLGFFDTAKKKNPKEDIVLKKLKGQLYRSKLELEAAMDNFNNVTDPKLIDFYIYRIQSEEARFGKILSEIKDLM